MQIKGRFKLHILKIYLSISNANKAVLPTRVLVTKVS